MVQLPNDPAIPTLVYPKEGYYHFTKTWPRALRTALFQKLKAYTDVHQQDYEVLKDVLYLYTEILFSNKMEMNY